MPFMPDPQDWSYSGNPASSDRDQVRYLVGDTDPAVRMLSDAEVDFEIATWMPRLDNLIGVAAVIADRIATKLAGIPSISADGVSVNLAELRENFIAAASRLRAEYARAQDGGEIDLENLMVGAHLDASIEPLNFGIGMHDNPQAGQQAYGGRARTAPDRDDWSSGGW